MIKLVHSRRRLHAKPDACRRRRRRRRSAPHVAKFSVVYQPPEHAGSSTIATPKHIVVAGHLTVVMNAPIARGHQRHHPLQTNANLIQRRRSARRTACVIGIRRRRRANVKSKQATRASEAHGNAGSLVGVGVCTFALADFWGLVCSSHHGALCPLITEGLQLCRVRGSDGRSSACFGSPMSGPYAGRT